MSRPPRHRDAIVRAAALLFRRHGYAATGLARIVAESGAPKGSVYHYFPAGKSAIGAAAVDFAGELVRHSLQSLAERSETPGALLRAYAGQLAGWMAQSGFRDGCPIATILLEAAADEPGIRAAGARAGADWTRILATALRERGVAPKRARRLALTAIAALEGSLIQARVAVDTTPILEVAEEIGELFDAAVADASRVLRTPVTAPRRG